MKKGSCKLIEQGIVDGIIKLYNEKKATADYIRKLYKIGEGVLKRILQENNVPIRGLSESKRKNTFDDKYFEKIDTRDKAYYLGLIFADGHNNIKGGQLVLNLHEKDIEILEKFKESIQYTGNIGTWSRKPPRGNVRVVAIRSHKLCSDLEKLGCTQQKTLVLKYPYWMNKKLQMDFIRGFFDGDGTINTSKKHAVTLSFIAIKDMADGVAKYLGDYINKEVSPNKWTEGKYTIDDLRQVRISNKKDIKKIMDCWYKDTETYLNRKYDIYYKAFYIDKLADYELYTSNKYTGKNGGNSKPIIQYDMDDNIIREWPSINEAERAGYKGSYICVVCKENGISHKGYKWKYKHDE